MRKRVLAASIVTAATVFFTACGGLSEQVRSRMGNVANPGLDAETVAAGLREALEQGSTRAVQELGRDGGYWSRPTFRIPVPEDLQRIDTALRRIGQGRIADDFVRSLNRAAEQATPAARTIFVSAIRRMTINDAIAILRGPEDAATQYFRRSTEAQLTASFTPIVSRSTQAVGVTASYKHIVQRAQALGFADTARYDIDSYVTRKALDALFTLVGEEERHIRENPVARTTELMRKVFR